MYNLLLFTKPTQEIYKRNRNDRLIEDREPFFIKKMIELLKL